MTADLVGLATAAASGGGITLLGQWAGDWFKGRREDEKHEQSMDARLEEHRDNLTLDMLKAAREEVHAMREEVALSRASGARVAHLEEALDHLHALLNAEGEHEVVAAQRRARAFLKRMRPEIGDLRNQAQRMRSAKNVSNDLEGDDGHAA